MLELQAFYNFAMDAWGIVVSVYNFINNHAILSGFIVFAISAMAVWLFKSKRKAVANLFTKIIDFFRSWWNRVVSAIKSMPDKFWQYVARKVSPWLEGNFDNKESKASVATDIDTENQKTQNSSKDEEDYKKAREFYDAGNHKDAEAIFERLAKKDMFEAKDAIGVMYYFGHGKEQSKEKAEKLFRECAYLGHENAQNNLGVLYKNGEGVIKNYILAYAWFILSKAQGNEKAEKNLDKIAKHMTNEAIEKAQAKALKLDAEIKANIEAKEKAGKKESLTYHG